MALKLFALLRLPVAVFALLGFASGGGSLGAWFCLGAYVYLGAVTVQLWRARPNAMGLTIALLLLELPGGTLFLLTADILSGRVELPGAAVIGLGVVAVWGLPNLVALYFLRGKFVPTVADVEKPGG